MLLWLLPNTPIEQLPVMPKFDHGQAQQVTFVKVRDPNERSVIRFWPSPYAVLLAAGESPRPLWQGTLTIESRRPLSSLGVLLITEPNFRRPIEQLLQDLQERNISVEKRERENTSVLLIW